MFRIFHVRTSHVPYFSCPQEPSVPGIYRDLMSAPHEHVPVNIRDPEGEIRRFKWSGYLLVYSSFLQALF